jgi:GMP synthase-like glutamine amidotransferase
MKINVIQHVDFETPGILNTWAVERGHEIIVDHIYRGDRLPNPQDVEFLIMMGGTMGTSDESSYAWMRDEKKFLKDFLKLKRPTLGICLGAQLIAEVLGGEVHKGPSYELGWAPLTIDEDSKRYLSELSIPNGIAVFHNHGDTYSLPYGAKRLFSSNAYREEGFRIDDCIIGLQCHFEVTPRVLMDFFEREKGDIKFEQFFPINSEGKALADEYCSEANEALFRLADSLVDVIAYRNIKG